MTSCIEHSVVNVEKKSYLYLAHFHPFFHPVNIAHAGLSLQFPHYELALFYFIFKKKGLIDSPLNCVPAEQWFANHPQECNLSTLRQTTKPATQQSQSGSVPNCLAHFNFLIWHFCVTRADNAKSSPRLKNNHETITENGRLLVAKQDP